MNAAQLIHDLNAETNALRAERDQLREDLEWNVAEADRVAKALIEQVAYANHYRTTLVEIANGVHGMASVLAARALDPTEAPDDKYREAAEAFEREWMTRGTTP